MDEILVIKNGAGFFSCCSSRFFEIINYIKKYKKLPNLIDSSQQFKEYKEDIHKDKDIAPHFFKLNNEINIENKDIIISSDNKELQFSNYKLINFKEINPIINKYFSPSDIITDKISFLEKKYNIQYDKLLTVYYRSTDKSIETNIPSVRTIINKIVEVKKSNPGLQILYMTDDLNSIEKINKKFKNVIIIEEVEKYYHRSYNHAQWFLSSLIIMSKSHSIITTSGNVSNWMIFYRNNSNNIYQYLSPKEYIYGVKNNSYDPTQKNFWY